MNKRKIGNALELLADALLAGVLLVVIAWCQHGRDYMLSRTSDASYGIPVQTAEAVPEEPETCSDPAGASSGKNAPAAVPGVSEEKAPPGENSGTAPEPVPSSSPEGYAVSAPEPVQTPSPAVLQSPAPEETRLPASGSVSDSESRQYTGGIDIVFDAARQIESSGFSGEEDPCKFAGLFTGETVLTEDTCSTPDMYIHITAYAAGENVLASSWVLADLYLRDPQDLKTAFAGGSYAKGRSSVTANRYLAEEVHALLSVNGDYYISQNESLVLRNGILYRQPVSDCDALVLYKDGTMKVFSGAELSTEEKTADAIRSAWQAWSFGPSLLDENGKARENLEGHKVGISARNPRTAVGYYEPGHYCFVVVNGRTKTAKGCTFDELAQVFEKLGCTLAYNLDGGASSSMVFNGHLVSCPAKERSVPDIIYIAEP